MKHGSWSCGSAGKEAYKGVELECQVPFHPPAHCKFITGGKYTLYGENEFTDCADWIGVSMSLVYLYAEWLCILCMCKKQTECSRGPYPGFRSLRWSREVLDRVKG